MSEQRGQWVAQGKGSALTASADSIANPGSVPPAALIARMPSMGTFKGMHASALACMPVASKACSARNQTDDR